MSRQRDKSAKDLANETEVGYDPIHRRTQEERLLKNQKEENTCVMVCVYGRFTGTETGYRVNNQDKRREEYLENEKKHIFYQETKLLSLNSDVT